MKPDKFLMKWRNHILIGDSRLLVAYTALNLQHHINLGMTDHMMQLWRLNKSFTEIKLTRIPDLELKKWYHQWLTGQIQIISQWTT